MFRQVHRQQKICLRVREEEYQLKRLKVKLKRMEPRLVMIFLMALSFPAFVQSSVRHYNFRVSAFAMFNFAGLWQMRLYKQGLRKGLLIIELWLTFDSFFECKKNVISFL